MKNSKNRRPLSVTFLALGVLSFAIIHLGRFALALAEWSFLASLPLTVSPIYLAATGLIWGIAGLVLYPGLWFGKRWAKKSVFFAVLVYGLYYWLEQLVIMDSPLRKVNWPFQITATVLILTYTNLVMRRPAARTYFGETHE
jgi:hypothetical protein